MELQKKTIAVSDTCKACRRVKWVVFGQQARHDDETGEAW